MEYTYEELRDMETLYEGHSSNLKVETPTMRVWLCRVEKGMIYVEKLRNGKWELVKSYRG